MVANEVYVVEIVGNYECEQYPGILYRIFSVPRNNAMDLNRVMNVHTIIMICS